MTTLPTTKDQTAGAAQDIMAKSGKEVKASSKKIAEQKPISFDITPSMEAVKVDPFKTIDLSVLTEAELAITRNLSSVLDWIPPEVLELLKQAPEFLKQLQDMDMTLEGFLTKLKTLLPDNLDISDLLTEFDIVDIFDNIERITSMLDPNTLKKMGVDFFKDLLTGCIGIDVEGVFNNVSTLFKNIGGTNGVAPPALPDTTPNPNTPPVVKTNASSGMNPPAIANKIDVGATVALTYALLNHNLKQSKSIEYSAISGYVKNNSTEKNALPLVLRLVGSQQSFTKIVDFVKNTPKPLLLDLLSPIISDGPTKPSDVKTYLNNLNNVLSLSDVVYTKLINTPRPVINFLTTIVGQNKEVLLALANHELTPSSERLLNTKVSTLLNPRFMPSISTASKHEFSVTTVKILTEDPHAAKFLAVKTISDYLWQYPINKFLGDTSFVTSIDDLAVQAPIGQLAEYSPIYVDTKQQLFDSIKSQYEKGVEHIGVLFSWATNIDKASLVDELTLFNIGIASTNGSGDMYAVVKDAGVKYFYDKDIIDAVSAVSSLTDKKNSSAFTPILSLDEFTTLKNETTLTTSLAVLNEVSTLVPPTVLMSVYDDIRTLTTNEVNLNAVSSIMNESSVGAVDISHIPTNLLKTVFLSVANTTVNNGDVAGLYNLVSLYPSLFTSGDRKRLARELICKYKKQVSFENGIWFIEMLNGICEDWGVCPTAPHLIDFGLINHASVDSLSLLSEGDINYALMIHSLNMG